VELVSKSDDPELLLAEALRAQAVSTPVNLPELPDVLRAEQAEAAPKPELAAKETSGSSVLTEEMMLRELTSGPVTGELATLRIDQTHHVETERFSPLENVFGPMGSGPGFGLVSGTEVGSTVGPPVGEFDHLNPNAPANTMSTTKLPTQRGQVSAWLILLFALLLGLAGGSVAGMLSML
jgi:hypothetical protein